MAILIAPQYFMWLFCHIFSALFLLAYHFSKERYFRISTLFISIILLGYGYFFIAGEGEICDIEAGDLVCQSYQFKIGELNVISFALFLYALILLILEFLSPLKETTEKESEEISRLF